MISIKRWVEFSKVKSVFNDWYKKYHMRRLTRIWLKIFIKKFLIIYGSTVLFIFLRIMTIFESPYTLNTVFDIYGDFSYNINVLINFIIWWILIKIAIYLKFVLMYIEFIFLVMIPTFIFQLDFLGTVYEYNEAIFLLGRFYWKPKTFYYFLILIFVIWNTFGYIFYYKKQKVIAYLNYLWETSKDEYEIFTGHMVWLWSRIIYLFILFSSSFSAFFNFWLCGYCIYKDKTLLDKEFKNLPNLYVDINDFYGNDEKLLRLLKYLKLIKQESELMEIFFENDLIFSNIFLEKIPFI